MSQRQPEVLETGDEAQIASFCERNFGVTFPLFSKVDVNGDDAHPLFDWLKDSKGGLLGDRIKWNFTKFLVGKDGQPIPPKNGQGAGKPAPNGGLTNDPKNIQPPVSRNRR